MKSLAGTNLFFISVVLLTCNWKMNKGNDGSTPRFNDSLRIVKNQDLGKDGQHATSSYFKANGTEPFWGLEISENGIKFTTIGDSIMTPHVDPIRAMDANVKMYKSETEAVTMTIQIIQQACTNAMSGAEFPYRASITFKRATDENTSEWEGCGHYITDYRLHDIWVLESINGSAVTKTDFSKEYPTLEINSGTNTFMGFAGCNRMNGRTFFERGLLSFTNIATTKMLCEPNNKEPEFLKALQHTTRYRIENNHLTLTNPGRESIVFKKID